MKKNEESQNNLALFVCFLTKFSKSEPINYIVNKVIKKEWNEHGGNSALGSYVFRVGFVHKHNCIPL